MSKPTGNKSRNCVYGILENNELIYETVSPNPSRTMRAFKRLFPEKYKEAVACGDSTKLGLQVGEFRTRTRRSQRHIGPMR